MLTVYQVKDSLDLQLPPSSIDLVISSPPLDVLSNRCVSLFKWFEACVKSTGVLLLDIPGQYNEYTIKLWEAERQSAWHFQHGNALHNFYEEGDAQSLVCYTRERASVKRFDDIPFAPLSERNMRHRCEYDPVYVKFLIEHYSKLGDTIMDPFCGTGMVPRVSRQLGRDAIGIDMRCPFTNVLGKAL